MPKPLLETATITEAAATAAKETGLLPIQFLSPGWGSSGHYSADVVEAAAADRVIPDGTHMYADHPHEDGSGVDMYGNRSLKDLMAVVEGDARIATDADQRAWGADPGALVGEARVVPAWRPLIETVRNQIGTSIRGSATDLIPGEAEGRSGMLVEGLVAPVMSVDFVTRAGRGGKVLSVMESAAANRSAIGHGIAEATVNDTREALQTALRDAYGSTAVDRSVWIYVRDFDDTTVWFEVEGSGAADPGVYGQTYANADGAVTLTGARTEVRVRTTYVPVTRPDSNTPTTEESQEDTMGKIQIEEAEHTRLTETAGRVDVLESELATEKTRRQQLEEAEATRVRTDAATKIVEAADADFNALERAGLLARISLTEAGAFDETAFTTLVTEAAAEKAKANGAGTIRGMGHQVGPVEEAGYTPAHADNAIAEAFGRPVAAGTKVQEA